LYKIFILFYFRNKATYVFSDQSKNFVDISLFSILSLILIIISNDESSFLFTIH